MKYIKKFRYDTEDASVKVGATTVFAQKVDVLPLMPSYYENQGELFVAGVVCVGMTVEIEEG